MATLFVTAIVVNILVVIMEANTMSSTVYDYIIVGAGAAGSVVASELSKDKRNTVLLIEEGGWSSEWKETIQNAENYWNVLNNQQIERGYMSTPQINVNNREIPLYRAKITGGCGAHYGMCWTLGNKKDFDQRWNVDNWRWKDLSKHWDHITKTFEINSIKQDKFTELFFDAAKQNGYQYNENYNDLNNGNGQYGASLFQYSVKLKQNTDLNKVFALRENTWTQYIEPIISKQNNLDIIVYNRVNKIIFDNNTAIGVETTNIGTNRKYIFYARKEVILSAGSFDTPKILLLSGIGDCNELKTEYNITECISDVYGVGKGLQEHIHFMIESPPLNINNLLIKNITLSSFIYATDFRVIMYDENSDFEFIFVVDPRHKMDLKYLLKTGTNIDCYKEYKPQTIQLFVLPLHLTSRGYVKLIDNNPESPPLININFLSNKHDRDLIIRLVKTGRKLLYSDSLINLYDNLDDEVLPGSHIKSDDEILEWSKTVLLTDYHPTSTAKMGMDMNDKSVVVDNRLKVKGVKNLRVVDASVMPEIVSAHTFAATALVAFRGAELILQDNLDDEESKVQDIKKQN